MSAVPAQKFREAVLQILFSLEIAQSTQEDLETLLSRELGVSRHVIGQAYHRALAILEQVQDLDRQIAEAAVNYDIARISSLEKAIIRLGVYELFKDNAIPEKVAIAEAVRLTRKFSSPQAAAFVNAVLDCLYQRSLGLTVDDKQLSATMGDLTRSQEISEKAAKESTKPSDEE